MLDVGCSMMDVLPSIPPVLLLARHDHHHHLILYCYCYSGTGTGSGRYPGNGDRIESLNAGEGEALDADGGGETEDRWMDGSEKKMRDPSESHHRFNISIHGRERKLIN